MEAEISSLVIWVTDNSALELHLIRFAFNLSVRFDFWEGSSSIVLQLDDET